MAIKLLNIYSSKSISLTEDFSTDSKEFFKGILSGAKGEIQKKLGLKTDDELEQEAKKDYESWFQSMGFKSVDIPGQEYFKAYILPVGSAGDGILFKFSVDPEYKKGVEDGKRDPVEDVGDTPTIVEVSFFDIPIDLGVVDALLPNVDSMDIDRIYDLFKKNNATFKKPQKPINQEVKGIIQAIQQLLNTKHLSMFTTKFTQNDVQTLKSLLKDGFKPTVHKDWVCSLIARGLSKNEMNIEYIRKLGGWKSFKSMYSQLLRDDKENSVLYTKLLNGDVEQINLNEMIKSGEVTKDYQYRMLKTAISNILKDWKQYIERYKGGNI